MSNLRLTKLNEHGYNTRHGSEFRLPSVKTNWGKHRLSYQATKEWNNLSENTKQGSKISQFKSKFL